jgi:hypothetical protein
MKRIKIYGLKRMKKLENKNKSPLKRGIKPIIPTFHPLYAMFLENLRIFYLNNVTSPFFVSSLPKARYFKTYTYTSCGALLPL